MLDDDDGLSLKQLCEEAGVSERTVRYYMQQGLLPAATRTGPGVRYPASHLARLKLVRRWQDSYLPLEQIRKMLSDLPDTEAERLSAAPPESAPAPRGKASSAADYVRQVLGAARPERTTRTPLPTASEPHRSQWERIVVDDDIELHVRRPLSHVKNRRVEALLAEARRILDKEAP